MKQCENIGLACRIRLASLTAHPDVGTWLEVVTHRMSLQIFPCQVLGAKAAWSVHIHRELHALPPLNNTTSYCYARDVISLPSGVLRVPYTAYHLCCTQRYRVPCRLFHRCKTKDRHYIRSVPLDHKLFCRTELIGCQHSAVLRCTSKAVMGQPELSAVGISPDQLIITMTNQ